MSSIYHDLDAIKAIALTNAKENNMNTLKNVALYAKGVYVKNDLVLDLHQCLEADNVICNNKDMIANVLYDYVLSIYNFAEANDLIAKLLMDFSPDKLWELGYYTKACETWFNRNEEAVEYDVSIAKIHVSLHHLNQMSWDILGLGPMYEGNADVLPLA